MDVSDLCAEVAKYDVLYNPLNSNFKNLHRKELAWRMVASALQDTEWFVCRDKFKKLRDAFVRSMRKRKCDGGSGKYKFEKELEFLVPYIKHRVNELLPNEDSDVKPLKNVESPITSLVPFAGRPTSPGRLVENFVKAGERTSVVRSWHNSEPLQDLKLGMDTNLSPSDSTSISTPSDNQQDCSTWPDVDIGTSTTNRGTDTFHLNPLCVPVPASCQADMFQEDDSAVFGRLVACSLRRLDRRVQIITRRRIFEILTESETEDYNSTLNIVKQ